MFDRTLFDKTLFDRTTDRQIYVSLYATITAQYNVLPEKIHAKVDIGDITLTSVAAIQVGPLSQYVPFQSLAIQSQYDLSGILSVHVPMGEVIIDAVMSLSVPALSAAESEEISLDNINLAPGHVIIIDTDSADILIDGEQNVDCWRAGSSFFSLLKGSNELRFYDNANTRELSVSVIWADRYK